MDENRCIFQLMPHINNSCAGVNTNQSNGRGVFVALEEEGLIRVVSVQTRARGSINKAQGSVYKI